MEKISASAPAPAIYEQAVTTDRTAEVIARKHGFESLARLADWLPENARVLDVGAGASPFGREVAKLRPDIAWTNFDYSYRNEMVLDQVKRDSPSNVAYVAEDAIELSELYGEGAFDAVFSYWLLPHLSLDDLEPAQKTARSLFTVTREQGLLSVGPQTRGRVLSQGHGKALRYVKDSVTTTADTYASEVVAQTRLTGLIRLLQRTSNAVATPYFGTTRYMQRQVNGPPEVYCPESGEYVPTLSREGMRTVIGLSRAVAAYAIEQNRDSLPSARRVATVVGVAAAGAVSGYHLKKNKSTK